MTIRAISVAAFAVLLLGGLGGCAMAPALSYPAAAALRAPAANPGTPAVVAPPAPVMQVPPISAGPPEPVPPISAAPRAVRAPIHAAPFGTEPDHALSRPIAPQQFSGSSTVPSAGRAATRRGDRRRPAGRHRDWDLDEQQIEAQWVNPPVGAGE